MLLSRAALAAFLICPLSSLTRGLTQVPPRRQKVNGWASVSPSRWPPICIVPLLSRFGRGDGITLACLSAGGVGPSREQTSTSAVRAPGSSPTDPPARHRPRRVHAGHSDAGQSAECERRKQTVAQRHPEAGQRAERARCEINLPRGPAIG